MARFLFRQKARDRRPESLSGARAAGTPDASGEVGSDHHHGVSVTAALNPQVSPRQQHSCIPERLEYCAHSRRLSLPFWVLRNHPALVTDSSQSLDGPIAGLKRQFEFLIEPLEPSLPARE